MLAFMKDVEPIECGDDEDWVVCHMSTCTIKRHIIDRKGGFISCDFTDLIRRDDYRVEDGATVRSTNRYILQNSDIVKVKCKAADGTR